MDVDTTTLRDCGHVGTLGGICQYEGCGAELCASCVTECQQCRRVLCAAHEHRVGDDDRSYCPDHVTGYLAKKLVTTIFDR